jgi:hypothetical protein
MPEVYNSELDITSWLEGWIDLLFKRRGIATELYPDRIVFCKGGNELELRYPFTLQELSDRIRKFNIEL